MIKIKFCVNEASALRCQHTLSLARLKVLKIKNS